jgi:hypothetical protein
MTCSGAIPKKLPTLPRAHSEFSTHASSLSLSLCFKFLHAEYAQVGEVLVAGNTFQVLVAFYRPEGAAAIGAAKVVAALCILRIIETVCILFLREFALAFYQYYIRQKVFELL